MALRTNLDRAIAKFRTKTERALDVTVQEVMSNCGFAAQTLSPYFTGAFRASWRISQNSVDTSTSPGAKSRRAANKEVRIREGSGVSSGLRDVPISSGEYNGLRDQALRQTAGNFHLLTNATKYGDVVNSGDPETGRKPTLIVQQIRLLFPGFVQAAATKARGKV